MLSLLESSPSLLVMFFDIYMLVRCPGHQAPLRRLVIKLRQHAELVTTFIPRLTPSKSTLTSIITESTKQVYMNVCGWTSFECSKLPWSMFNVLDIDYFSGRYVNMIKSLS